MISTLRSAGAGAAALVMASVLLTAQQQPARDTAARPTVGTAVLTGTVVTDDASARPVRRAMVTLNGGGGSPLGRVIVTDDNGRFAFTHLPAAAYSAPRVTKAGYVNATYGEKRPGGIGMPITLAEGQRLAITIKMMHGAVIAGTLFDQDGRPMVGTSVQATPIRILNGVRTPGYSVGNRASTTDDRGMYRIYGLPPGDYLVAASPRMQLSGDVRPITQAEIGWAEQQMRPAGPSASVGAAPAGIVPAPPPGQSTQYGPVFYPGVADASGASLVTLMVGQERTGVDFSVSLVPTAKIEGRLIDPDGRPPQAAQINIIPKTDDLAMLGSMAMMDMMLLNRPVYVNGKFTMAGVRPGQYTLTAKAAPLRGVGPGAAPGGPPGRGGPGPAPMTLWGSLDLSVNGVDQTDLTLRLEPGVTLSGRVAFEGETLQPPADLTRVTVRLTTAPSLTGVTVSVNVPSGAAAADGTFKLEGVTPGRYLLFASAPGGSPPAPGTSSPGAIWTLRSAMVGGLDAADRPFEVRPGQDLSNIVLAFTDKAAELSGKLLDQTGRPTPDLSVILFPTDKSLWGRNRRTRQPVRASTDGTFKFGSLPAGEYYLAALTDFDPADVTKPEFLEQVAAAALKVTIGEGEKKVQDLKIAGGG